MRTNIDIIYQNLNDADTLVPQNKDQNEKEAAEQLGEQYRRAKEVDCPNIIRG